MKYSNKKIARFLHYYNKKIYEKNKIDVIDVKPNYYLDTIKIPIIKIPKNTLLFRVVDDQNTDFAGIKIDEEKYCINPQYNVFFYFSPFVVDIIPKWYKDFKKIYIYVLTEDIYNISLITDKNITRTMRFDNNQFILSCDKINNEIIKGKTYDICLSNEFIENNKNIAGWISISSSDSFMAIKNLMDDTNKYTRYIKYMKFCKDKRDIIGPPEIALYPLKQRSNKNIITNKKDVKEFINNNNFNYKLIDVLDRKYDIIKQWLDNNIIINNDKFYFTYKK
jgi:hypothetical protein